MANVKEMFGKAKKVLGAPKVKKGINITKTVLVWLVVAIAVFMMVFTVISVNTVDKNGTRDIFGYQFYIVKSDSMKATHFEAGDIIISKKVDVSKLEVGDIITFISDAEESKGEVVTHMIKSIKIEDGTYAFETYGTSKGEDNTDSAYATVILGRYVGKLPGMGYFFKYLKTTPGYIICILVPFLLLILSQGINCVRLFRAYRKEQTDAIAAEKAQIEAERAESQRMMAELLALKAQLEKKESENAATSATDDKPEA